MSVKRLVARASAAGPTAAKLGMALKYTRYYKTHTNNTTIKQYEYVETLYTGIEALFAHGRITITYRYQVCNRNARVFFKSPGDWSSLSFVVRIMNCGFPRQKC